MSVTTVCPHCGGQIELIAGRRQPAHHDPPRSGPPPREPPRERKPWEKPPAPWNLERAQRFQMPFGKHEGKTMAQIAQADRGYVKWLAAECNNRNAKKAAELILETMTEPAGTGAPRTSPASTSAAQFDEFTSGEQ
jgi:Exodeoxyribonuclease X-like C-terminal